MIRFKDDLSTIKEFLKIAINTIIYHRWLNNTNYTEEISNISNLSYMRIKDKSIEQDITNLLNDISKNIQNRPFQVTLNFYTEKISYFFFTKNEGLWETWIFQIEININNSEDKEIKVRNHICDILKELNDKDFMPNIDLNGFDNIDTNNNNDLNNDKNFPYEIKTEFGQESFISILKNFNYSSAFDKII